MSNSDKFYPQNSPYFTPITKLNFKLNQSSKNNTILSNKQIQALEQCQSYATEASNKIKNQLPSSTRQLQAKVIFLQKQLQQLTYMLSQEMKTNEATQYFKNNINNLQQKLAQQQALNRTLQQQLALSQQNNIQLKDALLQMREGMDNLKQQVQNSRILDNSQARSTKLQQDIMNLNQQIQNLLMKLEMINHENKEGQQQKMQILVSYEKQQKQFNKLQQVNKELQQENFYLKEQIKKINEMAINDQRILFEEKEKLVRQIAQVKYQYENYLRSSRNRPCQIQYPMNNQLIQQLQQQKNMLRKQLENLSRKTSQEIKKIKEQQPNSKATQYQKQINSLKTIIQSYQEQSIMKAIEIQQLKQQFTLKQKKYIDNAKNQQASNKQTKNQQNQQQQLIKKQINQLKLEINQLKNEKYQTQQQNLKIRDNSQSLENFINQIKMKLEQKQNSIQILTKEKQLIRQDLLIAKNQIIQLNQQKQMLGSVSSIRNCLEKQSPTLPNQINNVAISFSNLPVQMIVSSSELKQVQRQNNRLKKTITQYEEKLKNQTSKYQQKIKKITIQNTVQKERIQQLARQFESKKVNQQSRQMQQAKHSNNTNFYKPSDKSQLNSFYQTNKTKFQKNDEQRQMQILKDQIYMLQKRLDKANKDINKLKNCLDEQLINNSITPRQPTSAIDRAIWLIQKLAEDYQLIKRDCHTIKEEKKILYAENDKFLILIDTLQYEKKKLLAQIKLLVRKNQYTEPIRYERQKNLSPPNYSDSLKINQIHKYQQKSKNNYQNEHQFIKETSKRNILELSSSNRHNNPNIYERYGAQKQKKQKNNRSNIDTLQQIQQFRQQRKNIFKKLRKDIQLLVQVQ